MHIQNGGLQKKFMKRKINKSNLGINLCGASALKYINVDPEYIEMAIKKTRMRDSDDLLWKDMRDIMNKYENKLRKNKSKYIINDLGKTVLKQHTIYFNSNGNPINKDVILDIYNEIKPGYSKIIGLGGSFIVKNSKNEIIDSSNWGHYVVIGKTKKKEISLVNVEEKKEYIGKSKIYDYIWQSWKQKDENNNNIEVVVSTEVVYDYQKGLVLYEKLDKKTKKSFLTKTKYTMKNNKSTVILDSSII